MPKEGKFIDNRFGFASFMLGLFSVLFFWLVIPSAIMGIVGIIFAIVQLRKGKSKFAVAGLILSIIGVIGTIFILIELIKLVNIGLAFMNCSNDPTSPDCEKVASYMGADKQTMDCLSNSSLPGCDTILESLGT
jgi:hypothetical protein